MTLKNRSHDIHLRPARNADGPAIQALVFSVLDEYGLAPDPDGTDADLRDIESSYHQRGGAFDVLEEPGGRVVGCVGILPIDAATCELRKMYLLSSARGRGLGRRLLESALAKARDNGFRRIVLETAAVLTEAISLYTRYGFTPYTPDHMSKRCNQAYSFDLAAPRGVPMEKVNLADKLALITEHWKPKVVGELNGQEVKLVKFQGTFVWHHHDREDELFLGVRGRFRVEFRDKTVELGPSEFVIVPHGVEHRTAADHEAEVLVFEPAATRNTGNVEHPTLTAPGGIRI